MYNNRSLSDEALARFYGAQVERRRAAVNDDLPEYKRRLDEANEWHAIYRSLAASEDLAQ